MADLKLNRGMAKRKIAEAIKKALNGISLDDSLEHEVTTHAGFEALSEGYVSVFVDGPRIKPHHFTVKVTSHLPPN